MIVVYSELKKLLPDLKVSGRKLGDDLTLIGHFCSGYKQDGPEHIYDLEIRAANRSDCLGYIGIARDLAAFYDLKIVLPHTPDQALEPTKKVNLDDQFKIQVSSPNLVKTLRACKIVDLKIQPSADWLIKLLSYHDINPINNLVDLTNYVMLLWGIPAHAFDANKVNNALNWCESTPRDNLTTFDGTKLDLTNNLVIKSGNGVVSMSSIGGNNSGIDETSKETIIEIAVYDPIKVHHDNRQLNIQTEAGSRLEKFLSPTVVLPAFYHLQKLVTDVCQGILTSESFIFDNYDYNPPQINFDPTKASVYAGIDIPSSTSLDILKKLGCTISGNTLTPPSYRTDLNIEEDLIEEVIRIYGYDKITNEEPIESSQKNNITPAIITLNESIKNILVSLGYDEIRSWPLVKPSSLLPDLSPGLPVYAQNSINEEYPVLRQTLISSLLSQKEQYERYKVPITKFFELGKIFNLINNKYQEQASLGIYTNTPKDLEILEQKLATKLTWKNYQNYYEAILTDVTDFQVDASSIPGNHSYELTGQVHELDATLYLDEMQDPATLLKKYLNKLDKNILFSLVIKDYYHDQKNNKHNYTFTAWYYNCDSSKAKDVHLQAFELEDFRKSPQLGVDPKQATELVYYQDRYLQTLKAIILSTKSFQDHWVIVCDKTIFYPTGGGQVGDRGELDGIEIFDTTFDSGQVLHHTKNDPKLNPGQEVMLKLDWGHRYKYMLLHTAGHLLHDAIVSISPDLKPLKGDHGDHAYLTYKGNIKSTEKNKILAKYQELVSQNLDIISDDISEEKKSEILGNSAGNLPKNKRLRYIKIGAMSAMPDGGVHVKATGELPSIDIGIKNAPDGTTTVGYSLL